MGRGFESYPRGEHLDESYIRPEVRAYFESLDDHPDFWTAHELKDFKEKDLTFTTQLWNGLQTVLERLIELEEDKRIKKGLLKAKEIVRETYGHLTDDVEAVIKLREFLRLAGIPEANLSPSEILKYAYLDESERMVDQGLDPEANPPFNYGQFKKGVFDTGQDIFEELEQLELTEASKERDRKLIKQGDNDLNQLLKELEKQNPRFRELMKHLELPPSD